MRTEKGQKTAKRISYLDLCVNLPEGTRLPWPMKTTLEIFVRTTEKNPELPLRSICWFSLKFKFMEPK